MEASSGKNKDITAYNSTFDVFIYEWLRRKADVACFVGFYSSTYNLKFGGGKANSEIICIITE